MKTIEDRSASSAEAESIQHEQSSGQLASATSQMPASKEDLDTILYELELHQQKLADFAQEIEVLRQQEQLLITAFSNEKRVNTWLPIIITTILFTIFALIFAYDQANAQVSHLLGRQQAIELGIVHESLSTSQVRGLQEWYEVQRQHTVQLSPFFGAFGSGQLFSYKGEPVILTVEHVVPDAIARGRLRNTRESFEEIVTFMCETMPFPYTSIEGLSELYFNDQLTTEQPENFYSEFRMHQDGVCASDEVTLSDGVSVDSLPLLRIADQSKEYSTDTLVAYINQHGELAVGRLMIPYSPEAHAHNQAVFATNPEFTTHIKTDKDVPAELGALLRPGGDLLLYLYTPEELSAMGFDISKIAIAGQGCQGDSGSIVFVFDEQTSLQDFSEAPVLGTLAAVNYFSTKTILGPTCSPALIVMPVTEVPVGEINGD